MKLPLGGWTLGEKQYATGPSLRSGIMALQLPLSVDPKMTGTLFAI
jgi:hypothetical protein